MITLIDTSMIRVPSFRAAACVAAICTLSLFAPQVAAGQPEGPGPGIPPPSSGPVGTAPPTEPPPLTLFDPAAPMPDASLAPLGALNELAYVGASGLLAMQDTRASRSDQRAYEKAKKALDEQRYDQALEAFGEVASRAGHNADAATYWQAWTLNKLGRRAEALTRIAELRRTYPKSRWLDDAKTLEAEIRQSSGQPLRPETQADEDLKLMALNGLMHQNPANAVPLLDKFLRGTHPPKLKERALFVLAQSNTAQAREILGRVARGDSNPELQAKAIQYLGIHGSEESRTLLADIYKSSQDVGIKRRILQSFMTSGEKARLFDAAKGETSPELRAEAVRQLGVMGADEELWQLYQGEQAVEVRKQILQAMFVGGNADRLIDLAKTEKDPELRRTAVRNLGLIGSAKSGAALVTIYGSDQNATVRKEVIQALFIQDNARALIDLARKESDITMKKAIVQKLSIMDSKEAAEFMLEILNKP